ncbi:MAG: YcnI family protein [Caulobacteraceae bacterium]
MRTSLLSACLTAALFGGCGGASAHVVLAEPTAHAGSLFAGHFRVGHGCGGSATTTLEVRLPAGVVTARPQPKAGWTLEIRREPLASPLKGEGGAMLHERVAAVIWRGRLPDDQFDDFGLMAKLPEATGPLYFPTVQTCEAGEARWTDIPAPGAAWASVAHPAPMVMVEPASAEDPMAHMHH